MHGEGEAHGDVELTQWHPIQQDQDCDVAGVVVEAHKMIEAEGDDRVLLQLQAYLPVP